MALPVTSAAVLAVAVVAALGLLLGPGTGPAVAPGPAVLRRRDGHRRHPEQIDGQRVYRVADQAAFRTSSGSFLLAAVAGGRPACAAGPSALGSGAETDLLGCQSMVGLTNTSGAPDSGILVVLMRDQPALGIYGFGGWTGLLVVVRVHTHDPEAAECSAARQAACEAAVVVEAVVWPEVPTQVAGERVYRATDQASFPTSGSFLLGGPFTKPSVMPPCPMPMNETAAEQQLIPYCYILSIDGLSVAPMSNIDEPNGEIVVARVHIDDPLAAQCPASDRAQCQASIVVERWSGAAKRPRPVRRRRRVRRAA